MSDKKMPIVVQEWEESERGWGVRPDGATLHLNEADRVQYCKEFWERMKAYDKEHGITGAPDEYSRESGRPFLMDVDKATYKRVQASKNGAVLWQHEYRKLKKQ